MPDILLINTNCSWNKGSAAQVSSVIDTFNEVLPNAQFTLLSECFELDFAPCKRYGINIVGSKNNQPFSKQAFVFRLAQATDRLFRSMLWSTLNSIGINANRLLSNPILKQYQKADLVIDLSGDTLSDRGATCIYSIFHTLTAVFLKKKTIAFSQSIGPFSTFTTPLVRYCLNHLDLIVIRETETLNILKNIGVKNPNLKLAAEIAFLLKPAPPQRVAEIFAKEKVNQTSAPLIGLGTNELVYTLFKSDGDAYIKFLAKIADYLIEKFGARVLLISHVIVPPSIAHDDRFIANKVREVSKNKDKISILQQDYSAEELKGIIGTCDLFIGTRMHSDIAALSMCVPTVAIGWSHKYFGMMKLLNQEAYSCDVRFTTFAEVIQTITNAWENREELKKSLQQAVVELKRSAYESVVLVTNQINP
jgi:colanic acid/amylovoran biosynthesis protein